MSTAPPAILPHSKAKGVDMCGSASNGDLYIIRSDLHCYMKRSYDKKSKSNKYEIFPLHPAFQDCDHYIYSSTVKGGGIGPNFILIKDSKFLVTGPDLSMSKFNYGGSEAVDGKPLSAAMSNGENYCYDGSNYYKFYNGGKDCMAAPSLTSENPTHYSVPSSCQNGLYYYGTIYPSVYTIGVLTTNPFGVVTRLVSSDMTLSTPFFVSPEVLDFLPGGLAFCYGRPIHGWQLLKSFENSSNAKLNWSASITKTIGFSESVFHSLEEKWNVTKSASIGTSFENSFLIKASIQAQFSLSTQYGGASVQTNQADWNEQQSTTESLVVDVGPGETAYIWQYRLGFAGMSNSFLYCRDLAITSSNKPPATGRLPDALEDAQEEPQQEAFSSEATHEIPQGTPGSSDTPPSSDPTI